MSPPRTTSREAVHDAMNSALASDSAEQNSEHNFAGEGQTANPLAIAKRSERSTCKECSAAAAIIIGLVVVMIALLAMGYFVGYYEGTRTLIRKIGPTPQQTAQAANYYSQLASNKTINYKGQSNYSTHAPASQTDSVQKQWRQWLKIVNYKGCSIARTINSRYLLRHGLTHGRRGPQAAGLDSAARPQWLTHEAATSTRPSEPLRPTH